MELQAAISNSQKLFPGLLKIGNPEKLSIEKMATWRNGLCKGVSKGCPGKRGSSTLDCVTSKVFSVSQLMLRPATEVTNMVANVPESLVYKKNDTLGFMNRRRTEQNVH